MEKISSDKKIFLTETPRICLNNKFLFKRIETFLGLNNYSIVSDIENSNVILINTCALTDDLIDNNVDYIKNIESEHPGKTMIIFGCLTKLINPENDKLIFIGPKDLIKMNFIFEHKISIENVNSSHLSDLQYSPEMIACKGYVQISQGCSNNCSYCNVKLAKGTVKSKALIEILDEVRNLLSSGVKEITLLSDECGSYGDDIDSDLPKLISDMLSIDKQLKIRIYTIYPDKLIKYYPRLKGYFQNKRISYICIPIQTGSKRLLKLMNREYDLTAIRNIVKEIKNQNIVIYTHIIYNFPTEGIEDLLKSIEMSSLFDYTFFLPYHDNKGTIASRIIPKCSKDDLEQKYAYIKNFLENGKKSGMVLKDNLSKIYYERKTDN